MEIFNENKEEKAIFISGALLFKTGFDKLNLTAWFLYDPWAKSGFKFLNKRLIYISRLFFISIKIEVALGLVVILHIILAMVPLLQPCIIIAVCFKFFLEDYCNVCINLTYCN